MHPDCNPDGCDRTVVTGEIDPVIVMLVSYAERVGRAETEIQFRARDFRDVNGKLEATTKQLQDETYQRKYAENRTQQLNDYAIRLERKVPKKKVVKKVAKTKKGK